MATSMMMMCECGGRIQISISKVSFYGLVPMEGTGYDIEYFQEIDREEMESGEVAMVKEYAKAFGCQFVESREVEKFSCINCQREIRLSDLFNQISKNMGMGGGQ